MESENEQLLPISDVRSAAQRISTHVLRTPTIEWPMVTDSHPQAGKLWVKLELLQRTGSFKPRGALNTVLHMLDEHKADLSTFPGITAFSAGNHAIATAYAARRLGVSAKVVMPKTANPFRVGRVKALGAELVMGDKIADLINIVEKIQRSEGRYLVHPFEGLQTAQGTATVALELCEDVPDLDAVVVPVGGGGLISGMAAAVKQLQPQCQVFGVEPTGANGMQRSLERNSPAEHVSVETIADSLGAPMHCPGSFALVQQFVDEIVCVSDEQMKQAMGQMFSELKLAVEPACAAALAALNGPLSSKLAGKRTALIACGSNIDTATYLKLIGA